MAKKGRMGSGGRLADAMPAAAAALNASVDFDQRLAHVDIQGSLAHAQMLESVGLISAEDLQSITAGLATIREEIEDGRFQWQAALEDVHINIETRLIALIGEAGKRLHTARSRNDQVATDLRLWLAERCGDLRAQVLELQRSLVHAARGGLDVILPGYTHLQRAQPVRAAHHLLAYVEMLRRDGDRLEGARARALEECPLGAAALAGTPFPIDRARVAHALGFERPSANSMDAVASRDFALEFLAAAAILMTNLSRLGEELVIWSSSEFGFVTLPDAYCTSSSIMPQKKNPDIPELARAKVGRVVGDLVGLLSVIKGLPLSYNKDLQEDKEPVFDAADTCGLVLEAMAGLVHDLVFDPERCANAAATGYTTATDVADFLVEQGLPFREAHGVVGTMVREAIARDMALDGFSDTELSAFHPALGPQVRQVLDPRSSVERRDLVGGPARRQVLSAIEDWEQTLAGTP